MGWIRKIIVGITSFIVGSFGASICGPATFGSFEISVLGAAVATIAVIAEHALSGGFSGEKMKLKK